MKSKNLEELLRIINSKLDKIRGLSFIFKENSKLKTLRYQKMIILKKLLNYTLISLQNKKMIKELY